MSSQAHDTPPESWHLWFERGFLEDRETLDPTTEDGKKCSQALGFHLRVMGLLGAQDRDASSSSSSPSSSSSTCTTSSSSLSPSLPPDFAAHIQHHVEAVASFARSQLDRQALTLSSNTHKAASAEQARALVQTHHFVLNVTLQSPPKRLSVQWLTQLHAELLQGQPTAKPGIIRTSSSARAGKTAFLPGRLVGLVLRRFVINSNALLERKEVSAVGVAAAMQAAFLAIHPFSDGNGRLSRILVNWALRLRGLPFSVALAATASQRRGFIHALRKFQTAGETRGASQDLANHIAEAVSKAWAECGRLVSEQSTKGKDAEATAAVAEARRKQREEGSCIICFNASPNISSLCCGTPLHLQCLARWLGESPNPSCVSCRAPMPRTRPSQTALAVSPAQDAQIRGDAVMAAILGMWESQNRRLLSHDEDDSTTSEDGQDSTSTTETTATEDPECRWCTNKKAQACTNGMCSNCCAESHRIGESFDCARHGHPASASGEEDTTTGDATTEDSSNSTTEDAATEGSTTEGNCSMSNRVCRDWNCSNKSAVACSNGMCAGCCTMMGGYACERHATEGM